MAKKAASMKYQAVAHRGKDRKASIITEVTEKVQKAKSMVFTNYQGLTHHQLESLKKASKKVNAEYVATKNTLLLRSLTNITLSDEEKKQFEQPTATLFIYADMVDPLKELSKSIKELKLPVIKFGILDGKVVTASQVEKIATLPPLPVLRAQLLGQMQSPISGLHRALRWNLQSLVMTLNAVAQKKPAA